jgi:hypothetical protein
MTRLENPTLTIGRSIMVTIHGAMYVSLNIMRGANPGLLESVMIASVIVRSGRTHGMLTESGLELASLILAD